MRRAAPVVRSMVETIAAIAAAAAAGCWSPVGTCGQEQATRTTQYPSGKSPGALVPVGDGGFVISGSSDGDSDDFLPYAGQYASCRDFCSVQSEMLSLTSCEGPTPLVIDGGADDGGAASFWSIACDGTWVSCSFPVWIEPPPAPGSGRTTEGWRAHSAALRAGAAAGGGRRRARSSVGEHFARLAVDEQAAVIAFGRLARELRAHGSPLALVARAERAAREEVRHAGAMRRLARRFGIDVARVPVAPLPVRPLEAVALENVREGCARETLGAILVAFQALRAEDAEVRATLAAIARDEAGHAALSWDIARWAERRLPARSRSRLDAAMQRARAALDGYRSPACDDPELLGLPTGAEVRRMVEALRATPFG